MISKYFTVSNVVGLFSVGMFSIAVFVFYSSYITSSWPLTEGRITYSDARKLGGSSGPKGPVLSVTINEAIYTYHVNDYEYFGHAPVNSKESKTPNQTIQVYYNPNNPSQSVLYNGINWPYIMGFSFAGMLFAYVAYSRQKP
jgi:hypothetical protein